MISFLFTWMDNASVIILQYNNTFLWNFLHLNIYKPRQNYLCTYDNLRPKVHYFEPLMSGNWLSHFTSVLNLS